MSKTARSGLWPPIPAPILMIRVFLIMISASVVFAGGQAAPSGRLDRFKAVPSAASIPASPMIRTPGEFSGYTNYWHDVAWTWHQYGNLFQMSTLNVEAALGQAKLDTAEELGLPGLSLEEGFLSGYLAAPVRTLDNPSPDGIEKALAESERNLLVLAGLSTDTGRRLWTIAHPEGGSPQPGPSPGRQIRARDFRSLQAFRIADENRCLFVVLSDSPEDRARLRVLLTDLESVVRRFDLHRGWFGANTLLHSVTCFPGHPLEVMAKGMNQGNDWITFSGYMDFMLQRQLPEWLDKVGLNIVTDVGTGKATHSLGTIAFGLRDWDGLKIQDMPTEEEWIAFVKERGGFLFRPVFAPDADKYRYDGRIAVEGNKRQIDNGDVPFILPTGFIREDSPSCMILFTPKGEPFTREAMWRAILERRATGILAQGKMLGPRLFRNALQMLWLDRAFLEDYFGDAVQLSAEVQGRNLVVRLVNTGGRPIQGTISVRTGPELATIGESRRAVTLPPNRSGTEFFKLALSKEAMGRANPVLVECEWPGGIKRTLALADLPPAVSVHRLLYGQAPAVLFPISIHNFSETPQVPFKVHVFRSKGDRGLVYKRDFTMPIPPSTWREMDVELPLAPGGYEAVVSALGAEARCQIGVETAAGRARCTPVDLDGDGIMEYRLENDRVRVTLLTVGARVIEYIVKEKSDNVFFKLWPEKETSTDDRPFRERGFYPYGGFEDFLGQASIETHKIYEAEVVRAEGSFVQVRMRADYYGNQMEKVFTLYGDSPLVEIRFALNFRNPELNMLGPQPILEIGKKHGPEDLFVVPEKGGLSEFRMRPEEYFGRVLHPVEGWNAGYDEIEDITFVGAFPVSEPEFLHMWMNHPSNGESNHYYAEFQPWVPIFQKTRRYFSYYLWAAPGNWKPAVEELRRRNLITTK